jgi:hypothetical protein
MACQDCSEDYTRGAVKRLTSLSTDDCFSVGDVCNPIKDELSETENERQISRYNGLHIVPYMGENSTALKLFSRLSSLSPTQSACINSIGDFALGGELTVKRKRARGFAPLREADEPTEAEASQFIDFLRQFASGGELLGTAKQLYSNMQENGNMWLQVTMTQTAGIRSATIKAHDQLHVRYLYTPVGSDRYAYISPEWSTQYIGDNPPVLLPVFPLIGEIEEGVYSTLIHSANLTTDRRWYGVPPSMGSIYSQWLEVLRGDYSQKEYGNGFTGKHFVEVEGDGSSDLSSLASNFRNVFTRSGQARSIVLRQRSVNQQPARVYSFRKNTDEAFQKFASEDAESQIIKSHNWASVLIGIADAGKLGATSYLNDLYKWKYQTVIKPWQNKVLMPINTAVELVADWMQVEEAKQYSLGLTNSMRELLEAENDAD